MRLLLTRPLSDAERTAAELRASGHDVIIAPLLHIEPLPYTAIGTGPWTAILVTSANAAAAMAAHSSAAPLRALPAFATGRQSAVAMAAAGFADVTSAEGNVSDLAAFVSARLKPPGRLLYLAGEDRAGDLGEELAAKGFAVDTVVVYRAVAAHSLPPTAAAALTRGIDGVLHFSRRSAATYVEAARAAGLAAAALQPVHFCLSVQVAEPLAQAGAADIRIATSPTAAALTALIGTT